MKGNKLWKRVLLVLLLIIFILLLGNFIKNMLILNRLRDKVSEWNQKDNIYMKIETDSAIIQRYKKDNIEKTIIQHKKENLIYTQIIKEDIRFLFTEKGSEKTVATYKATSSDMSNMIGDYTDTDNFLEKMLMLGSNISIENVNHKICYAISQKNNSNRFNPDGCKTNILYVEKETGLPIQQIIEFDEYKEINTYEYSFNTVSDEDLTIPDIAQYEEK